MRTSPILRNFVSKYVPLTDPEFAYFESLFENRKFAKNQTILQEGDIEPYLNFIETGLTRLFFLKGKEEVVMQFSMENEVICCYESYLSDKPSSFSTEALEPTEMLSITRENLEKLFAFSPKIERLGRLFATEEYLKKAAFDFHRVRVTPRERFIEFIKDNAHLLQRIPQKYLASYLDMKPETFSRMKRFSMGR